MKILRKSTPEKQLIYEQKKHDRDISIKKTTMRKNSVINKYYYSNWIYNKKAVLDLYVISWTKITSKA